MTSVRRASTRIARLLVAIAACGVSSAATRARADCQTACTARPVDAACNPVVPLAHDPLLLEVVCRSMCSSIRGGKPIPEQELLLEADYGDERWGDLGARFVAAPETTCAAGHAYRWQGTVDIARYRVKRRGTVIDAFVIGSPAVPVPAPRPSPSSPRPTYQTLDVPHGRTWPNYTWMRSGFVWEGAFGASAAFSDRRSKKGEHPPPFALDGLAAASLIVGAHSARPHDGQDAVWEPASSGMRWCMPIVACGIVGMLFAPKGTFLGNDQGIDLRIAREVNLRSGQFGTLASLRPTFRFVNGAFRTGTFLGDVVPAAGIFAGDDGLASVTLQWSYYPVDVLVAEGLALGIEPIRVGVRIPTDGARATADGSGEVLLRFVP